MCGFVWREDIYEKIAFTRISNFENPFNGLNFFFILLFTRNPTTGGDTLSPHFWFQVFYYFYSSNFFLHNWNLLGRIYLLTKVIGILGVFLPTPLAVAWVNRWTFYSPPPPPPPSSHHQLFVSLRYSKLHGGPGSFAVMRSCYSWGLFGLFKWSKYICFYLLKNIGRAFFLNLI